MLLRFFLIFSFEGFVLFFLYCLFYFSCKFVEFLFLKWVRNILGDCVEVFDYREIRVVVIFYFGYFAFREIWFFLVAVMLVDGLCTYLYKYVRVRIVFIRFFFFCVCVLDVDV